jgi:hypothetical protein
VTLRLHLVISEPMTDSLTTPEEIDALRRMTSAEKLRQIAAIHIQARQWKRAALKKQHPAWTPEQTERRLREIFLYGTG